MESQSFHPETSKLQVKVISGNNIYDIETKVTDEVVTVKKLLRLSSAGDIQILRCVKLIVVIESPPCEIRSITRNVPLLS